MKKKFLIPLFILGAIAFVFIIGTAVMWLWNILVPELFHGPTITYWQAIGLLVLSRILVGSFGKGHRYSNKRRWGRWKEKMESMNPEERAKLRELWKKRCCGDYNEEDMMKGENPNTGD